MIDILIIVIAVISIFRGYRIGFIRQFLSTVGFFGGLLLGAYLEKYTVIYGHTTISRSLIGLATTLGLAIIAVTILEFFANKLKTALTKIHLNFLDNELGSLISLVSVIIGIWLGASLINSIQVPSIQIAINQSKIISYLNHILPPAPTIIADLSHIIDPNGFPQVFLNGEPAINQNVPLPSLGTLQPAVLSDEKSVVKIIGQGCGGIVEGTGFIVAPNLIMTNAHVVAGIAHPYITNLSGQTYQAHPIWFDPNLDLSILKVNNLPGTALTLSTKNYASGTPGAVLGYPGGGSFTVVPAAIISQISARGQNIYGNGNITRSIYEINANVIPGNSGGPLISKSGKVIGIVFAESTTYAHTGYALVTAAAINELTQAETNNQLVGTGSCAK